MIYTVKVKSGEVWIVYTVEADTQEQVNDWLAAQIAPEKLEDDYTVDSA